jgi:uncharacterized FlaG/YvyC family protein
MDVARVYDGYIPPVPVSGEYVTVSEAETVAVAPPPAAEVRTAERRDTDTLQRAVNDINKSITVHNRHLGIRHHEPSNRRIVTVYDSETNEVIREIPPEKVLDAYANMLEMLGLFVDTRG